MAEKDDLKKADIELDVYKHSGITRNLVLTYKGKKVSIVEGVTLNVVTDERTDITEGLKELIKDCEEIYPDHPVIIQRKH